MNTLTRFIDSRLNFSRKSSTQEIIVIERELNNIGGQTNFPWHIYIILVSTWITYTTDKEQCCVFVGVES